MKGILISGPTGAGKSDLALSLAKRVVGELISCDSVQVYRGLDIGANKMHETDGIKQHLIDILDWNEKTNDGGDRKINFTVGDFIRSCHRCIDEVRERGNVPILVGGTGLYMDWLLHGKPGAPSTDDRSMSLVDSSLEGKNWDEAFKLLEVVDPIYSKTLSSNDWYRLRRALCVHRQSGGIALSYFTRREGPSLLKNGDDDWRCIYLGWKGDREHQLRALDLRCEEMILKGLLNEVKDLRKNGFNSSWQAGRAIGYKEALDFFDRCDDGMDRMNALKLFIADFQAQTRQYTRKQEKWFISQRPPFKFLLREPLKICKEENEKNSIDLSDKIETLFKMDVNLFNSIELGDSLILEMEKNRTGMRLSGAKDSLRKYRSPQGRLTSSKEAMQDLLNKLFE